MMKRWILIALCLAIVLGAWAAWPYLFVRPALLAEAKKDIFAIGKVIPLDETRLPNLPVDDVVALNDHLRVRVVSDSHHNNYIGYSGSTYVVVNNRIFYRSGGYCAPEWLCTMPDLPKATEETFTAHLLLGRYQEIKR